MFPKRVSELESNLEHAMNDLLFKLNHIEDPDEYAKSVDQLTKLQNILAANKREKVSADTLATIAANLAGILVIVKHEQVNVIASKALGFVMKLR